LITGTEFQNGKEIIYMSTNNTKSGSSTTGIGLVGLWTVLATVFHFAGFGAFAEWPVIAWPWHWSCFCIAIWWTAIGALILAAVAIFYIVKIMREKKKGEEAKKSLDVAKLAAMGRFDEARQLAKENWPKGIPEHVMKHIEKLEEASKKNESNAT
jgi:hypothetical protein